MIMTKLLDTGGLIGYSEITLNALSSEQNAAIRRFFVLIGHFKPPAGEGGRKPKRMDLTPVR